MKRDISTGSLISLFLLAIITLNVAVLWVQNYQAESVPVSASAHRCVNAAPEYCDDEMPPTGPLPGEPPLHVTEDISPPVSPRFSPAQLALYRNDDMYWPDDLPDDDFWLGEESDYP
ncbi:hypothetical protein ACI5AD_001017 [Cronobacter sakazakii]|uniref:hypothetical protein n=1 Tax=Cronobacter sakazakii TaxID=28141 RepID=UPI000DA1DBDE|nr:hypothetical protein [Cronobacter sakazakii]EJC1154830.1 hypothetical protein [Cronobacter sakazakii]EJC1181297.1 hypothetical protein [Cronobacter sakazakii]EJC1243540.1 hypothetical protein [Cronobacter sakazakii]EJC2072448.1 hypothetical protein [Cronobacter sakazakii]EJK9927070.1 hypothetical protein [Cronobacter sakazakii]